jgi:hypothetical protein
LLVLLLLPLLLLLLLLLPLLVLLLLPLLLLLLLLLPVLVLLLLQVLSATNAARMKVTVHSRLHSSSIIFLVATRIMFFLIDILKSSTISCVNRVEVEG